MRKGIIGVVLIILLPSLGILLAQNFLASKDVPIVEICPKSESRDDWFNCLNAYFLSLAEFGNKPEVAIAELERRMRGSDDVDFKAACHEITHVLGEESYKKVGIERALSADLYQCIGGYSHGVFWTEAQDKSNPDQWSVSKIQDWCDKNRVVGSLPWEYCIHGSGHSAFIHEYDGKTKGTLSAIKKCERETERVNLKLDRCLDGVFMAWAVYASLYTNGPREYSPESYRGFDFEPGEKVFSMLEFCNKVGEYNNNYYNLCIEWRSRQVGLEHQQDDSGAELCQFSKLSTQEACYRRLIAYGEKDIKKSCITAPNEKSFEECYINRVRLDFERNIKSDDLLSKCYLENNEDLCRKTREVLEKDEEGVQDLIKRFEESYPELEIK